MLRKHGSWLGCLSGSRQPNLTIDYHKFCDPNNKLFRVFTFFLFGGRVLLAIDWTCFIID